jgi:aminopeptidase N
MENASQIYYADRLFRKPDGIGEGLIAHETAHQWFGNSATEREWAHAWLSEGFATFFAALWTQQARGDSAYRAEMAEARRVVLAAPEAAARAVIDSIETDPNRLLNRNTYQKGGLVLHMLRGVLGDSAFFRGVRAYYAAHRHANALTQDLQGVMEREAREPLGWFFDQWLRKPGWAELTTSWQWTAGSGQVTLTVEQGERFGAYRLPLTIDVEDASGAHRRVTVPIAAVARQTVVLPGTFSAAPARLTFDPDTALLATFTSR